MQWRASVRYAPALQIDHIRFTMAVKTIASARSLTVSIAVKCHKLQAVFEYLNRNR